MNDLQDDDVIINDDSDLSDFEECRDEFRLEDIESESSDESDNDVPSISQSRGWSAAQRTPAVNAFLGWQGPTAAAQQVSNAESPLHYFLLIFTSDVLGKVVMETNRYAAQALAANPPAPREISKKKPWVDVNEEEVNKFIGLTMMMGFVQKNGRITSYWSQDQRIATPYFPAVMSRNRFQQILSYLHFNNNNELPQNRDDKLFKIRPVYNMIVKRWRSLYDLGEHISIDESMVKWRGRLSFKVYQKEKPTKYGIKSYMLTDAKSKYCWNMDVYHGVSKTLKETVTGLLTSKCMSLWHSLYMDNFYNSVALSEFLLDQKVYTVGTLRRNRGEPPEIRDPGRMNSGDVVARDNGKVLVLAWKDKRVVKAITTKHDASMTTVARPKKRGRGEMEQVSKPACIVDYNKHMSGVDLLDQMISYYPFTRKTTKWTKKVFFYLVKISAHNAFVLYKAKSIHNDFNTFYKFLLELAGQLCRSSRQAGSSLDNKPSPSKQPRIDCEDRLCGGHKCHRLALFPARGVRKHAQKPCKVCRKHGQRKDTTYYCVHCDVALCVIPCFNKYHTEQRYWKKLQVKVFLLFFWFAFQNNVS